MKLSILLSKEIFIPCVSEKLINQRRVTSYYPYKLRLFHELRDAFIARVTS